MNKYLDCEGVRGQAVHVLRAREVARPQDELEILFNRLQQQRA